MSTLSDYLQVTTNLSKWQKVTQSAPAVKQQTKYFQDNIGKATTVAQFVNNPRLFNFALTAYGLGDQVKNKALFTKILQQGVGSQSNLAYTLHNVNILAFAKTFDFTGKGPAVTQQKGFADAIVSSYVEQTLESNEGQKSPGVQLALYFKRNAPNLTSTLGILADKNILTVVQTALGISPLTSAEPIDQQVALLKNKVNLADFKDPKKLQAFITRFTALYDYNNGGASGTSSASSNVLLYDSSTGGANGLDASTLLALQSVKRGF
jgi:hypothetical protein